MTTNTPSGNNSAPYGTYFRHWRSGKIYYAKDYGYKAWPFHKKGG